MTEDEITQYSSAHGVLSWLASNIRGDLAFECSNLALGTDKNATAKMMKMLRKTAKRAMYQGECKIVYERKTTVKEGGVIDLVAYSDASFQGRERAGSQRGATIGVCNILEGGRSMNGAMFAWEPKE